MSTKRAFDFERIFSGMSNTLVGRLFSLHAFAEEAPTEPTVTQPNIDALVAKARKEEKDKLYPRIQQLEAENSDLVKKHNDTLLKLSAAQDKLEEYKNKPQGASEQEVNDLKAQIATLTAALEEAKKAPTADQIRQQIEAEYSLKDYAREVVDKNRKKLVSILVPTVKGSTKEEIDAALKTALEQSAAVRKEMGIDEPEDEEEEPEGKPSKPPKTQTPTRRAPQTVNPTGDHARVGKYTPEQIRNMDVRSPEYKEYRASLGLK